MTRINFGTRTALETWKIVERESNSEREKKMCECERDRAVTFKILESLVFGKWKF